MGPTANIAAMEVALITVGDEVLSGDVVNTNANWLAAKLADRGVHVARILTVPDEPAVITDHVAGFSESFDRVIVTGGIGGTPDDVTMEAVAAAFDRSLAPNELTRTAVEERIAELAERAPDLDIEIDVDAEAAIPEDARPLLNEAGLAPGCLIENVYVMPGIPEEMKAMFENVAPEFDGALESEFLYTVEPEANIIDTLETVGDRFAVSVGCYPDHDAGHNRLKLTASERSSLDAARQWLLENMNASEEPVSRDR